MTNKPTADQMPTEVAAGEWTDVKRGMTPALGVKPHPDQDEFPGVLVDANDGSVVCWHNKGCTRKGIKPGAVEFDRNGAPWCPTCFAENLHRDPKWNTDDQQGGVLTPEPQGVADPNRQNERNRKALESGEFREPDGVLIGDDKVVADRG